MKKLLIAMTAAAVGTCAWAEGEAVGDPEPTTPTVTYLNESFSDNWTLTENAFWSYTGAAETELAITNVAAAEAAADYALALNTGSKVLTANFADNKSAVSMADRAYFNATVTFKDPSDTLPTLGEQDKFALVVLDNIESVGATTDTNTTNLWVIAKYGADNGVTRAFKLNIPVSNTETLQDLDAAWLADDHEIEIKAYANVMASTPARAGFLVMVDDHVCSVDYAAPIVNGVIDFTAAGLAYGESTYLGFESTDIAAAYRQRYVGVDNAKRQLLLSVVDSNANLTSVDFQGQGIIDNVALKDAFTGNFGEDSSAIEITAGPGVELTGECEGGTLFYSGSSATVTFTLKAGFALASENVVYAEDKAYSVDITPADYSNGYTIDSYEPKAFIGGTSYKTFALALAAGGEITLSKAITADDANGEGGFIDIVAGQTVTIDLNGNDIVDIVNAGNLTIKDSVGTGRVLENEGVSVSNEGTLTILGGCFEGAIKGATAKGISGGKFKDKTGLDEALADNRAFSNEATDGYWTVVEATVTPLPDLTIPEDAAPEVEKAAVEAALGNQADEAVKENITNKTEYVAFKTWAGTVTGGATAVVASPNAWTAYALDVPELVAGAKLTDEDITVETFVQDATAEDAGTFAIEIKIKDHEIGSNAVVEKIKTIIDAEGAASLENGLAGFDEDNVDFDVTVNDGKAKLKVKAKNGGDKFFFKMKFK